MHRILAVEDDPAMRRVLAETLAAERCECVLAGTAAEGLKACLAQKPDLVVMDVHLPDGDGIDLTRRIKADPRLGDIPVIILTGEAVELDSRLSGFEAGADDFVLKPFRVAEFLTRVRRLLARGARPGRT